MQKHVWDLYVIHNRKRENANRQRFYETPPFEQVLEKEH
jgi:hypothetical protein